MPADSTIIDFDDAKARQMCIGWIKTLKGPHRIRIRKCRAVRTLPQNAYYWAVCVPAIRRGLEDAWGESMSDEEVHEWLKAKFNSRTIVNRTTGEVIDKVPCSTATLDVQQFGEFLDKVIRFAGEQLHVEIEVPCGSPA